MLPLPSDQTPSDLLRRCLNRQPNEDWPRFLDHYSPRIRRAIVRALCHAGAPAHPELVRDLKQDVFCRLLVAARRRVGWVRGSSEGEAWNYFLQIVRTTVLDYLRRRRARRRQCVRATVDMRFLDGVVASDQTPEQRLLSAEEESQLEARYRACLAPHNRKRRARALRLALFEGWSSREIARDSGGALRASQVDGMVHRVRRRLAKQGVEVPRRTA